MITLFVDDGADAERNKGVAYSEYVKQKRGDLSVEDGDTEVLDVDEHGIKMEDVLYRLRIGVYRVEDSGHIHKKHGEHAPKVLYIPEEYVHRGEYKSNAHVEYDEAGDGNDKKEEGPAERHSVYDTEDEKYYEGKPEVNKRGEVAREEEEILRNVYLREYRGIIEKRGHAAIRRLGEIGVYDISAEEVGGVMLHSPAEEVREDKAHNEKGEKRRKNAPEHTEVGALIFFLKITLDKLAE